MEEPYLKRLKGEDFVIRDKGDVEVLKELKIPPKAVKIGNWRFVYEDELSNKLQCLLITASVAVGVVICGGLVFFINIINILNNG